jgi:transposase InsO family protein
VKLYLEEGYGADLVAEELGIGRSTLTAWAKRYREQGEAGLQPVSSWKGRRQVSNEAKRKAVELKRQNPEYGSKRISHLLKRVFLLRAGPETVRQTLKEEGLVQPPKRKPRRNPARPRFFERARPNQLWQTDIFTFRLGGRVAYLIGYLDDYSRYITAMGLYRSQTAEHVLEVYRRAIGEYGVPKEMLTDNGRQYTNWRGTTRFEAELKKERVAHIKSRPHHPMTLGKIERLWKSIFTEFLGRVQFDSFEEAQERLRLWIQYYNHKRPHQGIGGLCPADRFFEIQGELRKVMERGIEENVLETALRGQPRKPFYMVGRMGDQSVVIRAEKGKVKMLVDDSEAQSEEELVYDVDKRAAGEEDGTEAAAGAAGTGEVRGGVVGVGRAAQALGSVPGVGDQVGDFQRLAEPCPERDDIGPGAEEGPGAGTDASAGAEAGQAVGEDRATREPTEQAGEAAGDDPTEWSERDEAGLRRAVSTQVALLKAEEVPIVLELLRECVGKQRGQAYEGKKTGSSGTAEGGTDPEGQGRRAECFGGCEAVGGQPQDLLQVGEAGLGGDDGGPLRARLGPSGFGAGRREGALEEEGGEAGAGTAAHRAERTAAQVDQG